MHHERSWQYLALRGQTIPSLTAHLPEISGSFIIHRWDGVYSYHVNV